MEKVAAIQMNSSYDVNQNLELTRQLVCEASQQMVSLAVLPECFALMTSDRQQRLGNAESLDSPGKIQLFLSDLAREQRIWVLAAGLFTVCEDRDLVRNTTLLFDSGGKRVAKYDKMNLFDLSLSDDERYFESSYTEPGTDIVIAETPVGVCGITTCYDLRFPNLYQQLVSLGAHWFTIPSAFAYNTGKDHWEILLRARAIENHAYVVAPAQWGVHHGGRQTYGHTMIVNPWGKILTQREEGDGLVIAEIDIEYAEQVRTRFSKNSTKL